MKIEDNDMTPFGHADERLDFLLSKRKSMNKKGKELSKVKLIELLDLIMCIEEVYENHDR